METSTINILHLSDLHFSTKDAAKSFDQSVLLDALKDDLRFTCERGDRPDIVVFSGDLANAADEDEVYYELHSRLIEDISRLTGCSDERIFLCPGNHDLQRSALKDCKEKQQGIWSAFAEHGRDALNAAYINGDLFDIAEAKFKRFNEFHQYFGSGNSTLDDGIVRIDHVPHLPLDIISVNTALLSSGGLDGFPKDERRLLVPEAAIVKAINLCRKDSLRILVTHHPFGWLAEGCEQDISEAISGKVDFHLFGHMHYPNPHGIVHAKASVVVNQSGALYQGRKRYNGYAHISVDPAQRHSRVWARSYFDKLRKFDDGLDVVDGGKFYSSAESKKFWYELSKRISPEELRGWIDAHLLPAARRSFSEGLVDRSNHQLFVPPPLVKEEAVQDAKDDDLPEHDEVPVSFNDIVCGTQNWIIYGRQEYGKTVLLQQLALALMEMRGENCQSPTVPIIIDFSSIRAGERAVVSPLHASLSNLAEPSGFSVRELLEQGLAAVLVDDVDFSDSTRTKLLRRFMLEYPRSRFFLTSTVGPSDQVTAAFGGGVVATQDTGLFFESVFIRPFTRSKMRSLVKNWDTDGQIDHERVLNRLVKEMTSMNIPFTAINGAILLTIYEEKSAFTPINRAVLIEQFVEYALEKRSAQDVFRGAFDFKNKEFLLSALAAEMAKRDEYIISREQAEEIMRLSLKQVGLAHDVAKILTYFIDVRILRDRLEGCISFRYRAFLEYFIAAKMGSDENFKNWVLDEGRYLSYRNEILYYAGLTRHDEGLIELVSKRFEEIDGRIRNELEWSPDLRKLDRFEPPRNDQDDADIFDEFRRQIDAPPFTEEERDEALESELPKDVEDRQEVFRPKIGEVGQEWTMGLMLYSGLLKNLELISDPSKRRHLETILEGWGFLAVQSLAIIPLIAKHRKLRINGVLYEVQMPKHFSDQKVARLITLELPKSVGQFMVSTLGTEKLEMQLREPQLSEQGEPLICYFLRGKMMADLRIPGWVNELNRLADALQGSRFLTEGFIRTVSDIYQFGVHGNDTERKLRNLLGEAIGHMSGGTRSAKNKTKTRVIQNAERRALVRKLHLLASDDESGGGAN